MKLIQVMEVASLLNVGTVWVNSFAIERGVQVRKFSGNQKLSGAQVSFDHVHSNDQLLIFN